MEVFAQVQLSNFHYNIWVYIICFTIIYFQYNHHGAEISVI